MIAYRRDKADSAIELDVNEFLDQVEADLTRIEGTMRVLQRSLWDTQQALDTDKWGDEDAAALIADCLASVRERIEAFQTKMQ